MCTKEAFSVDGYYGFTSPARNAVFGQGIAIFVKPFLNPRALPIVSNSHLVVLTKVCNVIGFYFPPRTDLDDIAACVTEVLQSVNNLVPDVPKLVVGDFNYRTNRGNRRAILCNAFCNVLLDEFGLLLRNNPDIPTFRGPKGSSAIDLIFSDSLPIQVSVTPSFERRHCKVLISWKNDTPRDLQVERRYKRSVDTDLLSSDTSLEHVKPLLDHGAISSATALLEKAILRASTLKTRQHRYHKQWFDDECKTKKKRLVSLKRISYGDTFWAARRDYKKTCREKRRACEEKELIEKIEKSESKPWELFGKRKKISPAPVPLEDWGRHFSKLFDPDKQKPELRLPDTQELHEADSSVWHNQPFSPAVIANAIERPKKNKAAGPDNLINEHLQQSVPVLISLFTLLFNACLTFGTIATQWRTCNLFVLFKGKGSPNEPGNYRGIALLSVVFKLLTCILNRRIMISVENSLPPEQFGYRPRRSTREAIDELITYLQEKISRPKGRAYAAFIDFEKAFDSVQRPGLLQKLYSMGVKGLTLRLVKSILTRTGFKFSMVSGLRPP